MGEISITSEKEAFTNISNNFIKYYMADANGDFVKLYIYLAMLCSTQSQISVSDIADHLSCTENDICRGIRYWIKADVLSLSYNTDKEVTGILLKDLKKMDVTLKKKGRLSDDELDKVSGGYTEYQGYANGWEIKCPVCGRSGVNDFQSWMDDETRADFFLCRCGYTFAVNQNGTLFGSLIYD